MRLHEQATAFLLGDQGRSIVRRWLSRYRLPTHCFDDVIQDALIRVLTAEDRGMKPDNVDAFVTTVVQRAARDLLRGRLRRPEGHLADPPAEGEAWDFADDTAGPAQIALDSEAIAALGEQVDATRHVLGASLASKAHPAAMSLAVLAIVHGDAVPADDCPTPASGVGAEEGVWWAGVFYAGPDGCFAIDGEPEHAAVRKRRSRAINAAKSALAAAVADVNAGSESDGPSDD